MNDLDALLRPLGSLRAKCEKAQQRLAPGSWQHVRMVDSVHALCLASERLVSPMTDATADDLARARLALATLLSRTEAALPTFAEGSPQHTLLRNRRRALQAAQAALGHAP